MASMPRPLVCIVLLNWNRLVEISECLDSVDALEYKNFRTIIVDNGSSDGSVEVLRARYPQAAVIENKRNLGYAGGNNVGIRLALAQGADYVWLLNNDVEVLPDSLSRLVLVLESDWTIGLASPEVRFFRAVAQSQFVGQQVDWEHRRLITSTAASVSHTATPILMGAAMLIRREVIERIGLLDEKMFAYWEDTDFSVRAARAGFRAQVVRESVVYHKTELPDERRISRPPYYFFYMTRNEYFFWARHTASGATLELRAHILAGAIGDAEACRRRNGADAADACLDGAWSALRGVGGVFAQRARMPVFLKKLFGWHPYLWVALLRGEVLHQLMRRRRQH